MIHHSPDPDTSVRNGRLQIAMWLSDLYPSRELLWTLVYRDVHGRTRASLLGYAWIVAQPLVATGLLSVLVQGILGVRMVSELPYAVFVFSGMMLWTYFQGSLTAGTDSLVTHADLLRQVSFPRKVLVLYPFISRLIDFAISFLAFIALCLVFHVPLQIGLVPAPLLIIPVLLFGFGLALLFGPLNVAARDFGKALGIMIGLGLYVTPVLYPLTQIPPAWRSLYLLNPLAGAIEGFRALAIYGRMPDARVLGPGLVVAALTWLLGRWVFNRFEPTLADVV